MPIKSEYGSVKTFCVSKVKYEKMLAKSHNFDLIQAELALLLAFDISVSDFYAIYQLN